MMGNYHRFIQTIPLERWVALFIIVIGLTIPSYAKKELESEHIIALREEIQILNLLTNLYLTPTQMHQLIPKIKQAEQERNRLQSYLKSNEAQTIAALNQLRAELIAGKDISPDTERKINSIQGQAKKELYTMKQRIDAIADEVRNILNPNQRVVLVEYVPCLIPAKDIRHPALVGQAENDERLEQMLLRIRKMPQPVYEKNRENIVDRFLEHKKLYLKPEELEQEKRQLLQVLDEAYRLNETDFTVKKSVLLARMKPIRKHPTSIEFERDRVKLFLLDPKLIPILESRLASIAK
ncbi:MAG: hypothetical protein N3A72_06100 [bacterium]|nr:hypothetical protein [bacterium]